VSVDEVRRIWHGPQRIRQAPEGPARYAGLARREADSCKETTLHRRRFGESIGAAAVELTLDDLGEIDDVFAEIPVRGARYPEHLQRLVGR